MEKKGSNIKVISAPEKIYIDGNPRPTSHYPCSDGVVRTAKDLQNVWGIKSVQAAHSRALRECGVIDAQTRGDYSVIKLNKRKDINDENYFKCGSFERDMPTPPAAKGKYDTTKKNHCDTCPAPIKAGHYKKMLQKFNDKMARKGFLHPPKHFTAHPGQIIKTIDDLV